MTHIHVQPSQHPAGTAAAVVDAVIRSRKAVRAFLPTAVPRALVAEILEVARHAPSNSNTQPWRVHVLQGRARQALSEALLRSHEQDALPPSAHFPPQLPPACQRRQADFGARYYSAVGIDRGDQAARHRQTGQNFNFFGAPVGLIFTIDAVLGPHSWADYGMFLQSVMLAARARGLDSCPQVSFVRHAPVIRALLGLAADEAVVCGMSVGYAEPLAAVNRCAMPREDVEDFAVFWD